MSRLDPNLEQTHNGGDVVCLLPCSKRRDQDEGPAYEVYSINAVHKLKSILWDGNYDENVDTYIISAKYGIIPADAHVEDYDEKITQERVSEVTEWVGEFLEENDYDLFYSFVDGLYAKGVNEVAYRRNTQWNIDTLMFSPCARAASLDGIDMLDAILRKDVDINSATEVNW